MYSIRIYIRNVTLTHRRCEPCEQIRKQHFVHTCPTYELCFPGVGFCIRQMRTNDGITVRTYSVARVVYQFRERKNVNAD